MQWFADHRFHSFTLSDGLRRLRTGDLPPRALALTFDDGFLNTVTVGSPVLSALRVHSHGLPGKRLRRTTQRFPDAAGQRTVPATHGLGSRPRLTRSRAGKSVDTHVRTDLTRLVPGQLRVELEDSRTSIEQRLGSPIRAFAYPYGKHGARERGSVGKTYATAVSTRLVWRVACRTGSHSSASMRIT